MRRVDCSRDQCKSGNFKRLLRLKARGPASTALEIGARSFTSVSAIPTAIASGPRLGAFLSHSDAGTGIKMDGRAGPADCRR
jgi:hypothetical protein